MLTLSQDFTLIGIMMFNVVYALGEMAIIYPISGGFYTYSVRFIDPSWGFAMGYNYVFQVRSNDYELFLRHLQSMWCWFQTHWTHMLTEM